MASSGDDPDPEPKPSAPSSVPRKRSLKSAATTVKIIARATSQSRRREVAPVEGDNVQAPTVLKPSGTPSTGRKLRLKNAATTVKIIARAAPSKPADVEDRGPPQTVPSTRKLRLKKAATTVKIIARAAPQQVMPVRVVSPPGRERITVSASSNRGRPTTSDTMRSSSTSRSESRGRRARGDPFLFTQEQAQEQEEQSEQDATPKVFEECTRPHTDDPATPATPGLNAKPPQNRWHAPELHGVTLRVFSSSHPMRVAMNKMLHHPYSNAAVFFLVVLDTAATWVAVSTDDLKGQARDLVDLIQLTATGIYTAEAIAWLVVTGARAYVRNGWHVLEAVIVVSSWIDLLLKMLNIGFNFTSLRPLRIAKGLDHVRKIRLFRGVNSIFMALNEAASLLLNIVQVVAFFFLMFGILGLIAFGGSMRQQCVVAESLVPMNPVRYCQRDRGFEDDPTRSSCPRDWDGSLHLCVDGENPWYNQAGFDNFGSSIVTIFHVASLDEWPAKVMHPIRQGEPDFAMLVWIYFALVVLVVTFVVLNLFIAVITFTFDRVRQTENLGNEAATKALGGKQNLDNLTMQEIRDVLEVEKLGDDPKKLASHARSKYANLLFENGVANQDGLEGAAAEFDASPKSKAQLNTIADTEKSGDPDAGAWQQYQLGMLSFLRSNTVTRFLWVSILINAVLLASEFDGMSPTQKDVATKTEFALHWIFTAEFLLKFVALGKKYFRNFWGALDFVILIIDWVGYILFVLFPDLPNLQAVRVVALGRLFRIVRQSPRLKDLAQAMVASIRGVTDLVVFVTFWSVAYAIIGMGLLRKKFLAAGEVQFDTFPETCWTLFTVVTGDNWAVLMYLGMSPPEDNAVPLLDAVIGASYFLSFYILSNWVVLNLLVAVVLENFELHRDDQLRALQQRLRQAERTDQAAVHALARIKEDNPLECGHHNHEQAQEGTIDAQDEVPRNPVVAKFHAWHVTAEKIHGHRWFSRCTLALLLVFIALVCYEDPPSVDREKAQGGILPRIDYLLIVAMSTEIFITLSALGKDYFKSLWHIVDIVVLSAMLTEIILKNLLGSQNTQTVGIVLRAIRCLRPLNLIPRHHGVQGAVGTIWGSMPAVGYVVVLYAILTFIFAVLGVQIFAGKLFGCNDDSAVGKFDCIGVDWSSEDVPFPMPRAWARPQFHFDDLSTAFVSLFRVTTFEWVGTYEVVGAITGQDLQPKPGGNNIWATGFFITYIFVARFFVYTLFVAVTVRFFKMSAGVKMLTSKQKMWLETRNFLAHIRFDDHQRPSHPARAWAFDIVSDSRFEIGIAVVIFLNVGLMCSRSYGISEAHQQAVEIGGYIILAIYTAEMAFKLMAWGPALFLSQRWNVFDISSVAAAVVATIVPNQDAAGQFLEGLRAARILRIVGLNKNLTMMFRTLGLALPGLLNICSLFFVLLLIFAPLGVALFGDVKYGEQLGAGGRFSNFFWAALTLFQCMAGDSWDLFLDDCRLAVPKCTVMEDEDGRTITDCGTHGALVYFTLYYTMAVFVLLNLFAAVVIDNFSYAYEKVSKTVDQADVDQFLDVWSTYDVHNTGFVHLSLLRSLLDDLTGGFTPKLAGKDRRLNYLYIRNELEIKIQQRHEEDWFIFRLIAKVNRYRNDLKMRKAEKMLAGMDTAHLQALAATATAHRRGSNVRHMGKEKGVRDVKSFRTSIEAREAAARTARSVARVKHTQGEAGLKTIEHELRGRVSHGARYDAAIMRARLVQRGWHVEEYDPKDPLALEAKKRKALAENRAFSFMSRQPKEESFTINEAMTTTLLWNTQLEYLLPSEREVRERVRHRIQAGVAVSVIAAAYRGRRQRGSKFKAFKMRRASVSTTIMRSSPEPVVDELRPVSAGALSDTSDTAMGFHKRFAQLVSDQGFKQQARAKLIVSKSLSMVDVEDVVEDVVLEEAADVPRFDKAAEDRSWYKAPEMAALKFNDGVSLPGKVEDTLTSVGDQGTLVSTSGVLVSAVKSRYSPPELDTDERDMSSKFAELESRPGIGSMLRSRKMDDEAAKTQANGDAKTEPTASTNGAEAEKQRFMVLSSDMLLGPTRSKPGSRLSGPTYQPRLARSRLLREPPHRRSDNTQSPKAAQAASPKAAQAASPKAASPGVGLADDADPKPIQKRRAKYSSPK